MSVLLAAHDLTVGYDRTPVLANVNLELKAGEVTVLLGPNGSGKSTLLKTLSGLLPALTGRIEIDGRDLTQMTARQIAQSIAFVPQEEVWKFDFTAEQVVAMGRIPKSNGLFESKEDCEQAVAAMDRAGCADLRQRLVTKLSGGERQRVLIARALAQETQILFLDEPTSHLDPKYQAATSQLLRGLAKSGLAILVAMHDLPNVACTADKALLISAGRAGLVLDVDDALKSPELDRAYETEFDRIASPESGLIVLPKRTRT